MVEITLNGPRAEVNELLPAILVLRRGTTISEVVDLPNGDRMVELECSMPPRPAQ